MGDRGRFAPFGILGGGPATLARHTFLLHRGDYRPSHVTKDEAVLLEAGEGLRLETPGGGGWGDPLERDPAMVLEDLRRGYYGAEAARRDYGVVLQEGSRKVDEGATMALRRRRAGMPPAPQTPAKGGT